jgi:hypothetical protein
MPLLRSTADGLPAVTYTSEELTATASTTSDTAQDVSSPTDPATEDPAYETVESAGDRGYYSTPPPANVWEAAAQGGPEPPVQLAIGSAHVENLSATLSAVYAVLSAFVLVNPRDALPLIKQVPYALEVAAKVRSVASLSCLCEGGSQQNVSRECQGEIVVSSQRPGPGA